MGADEFGKRVRQARFALSARTGRQVTQAEIAQQLGLSGAAVGQWENGTKEPTLATIEGLARALDVSVAWLAFGVGSAADVDAPPLAMPDPRYDRRLTEEEIREAYREVEAQRRARESPRNGTTRQGGGNGGTG
jgi:transcriptional regulator with XRE-family HTH domain